MKKKFLRIMIMLLSLSTLGSPLIASANTNDSHFIEAQASTYTKTVTRTYPISVYLSGNLPKSVVADEIKVRQYYSGRLTLIDFYIGRNQEVIATYRGTMYPTTPGVTPLQIRK